MDNIQIAFVTDSHYLDFAIISIVSLLDNHRYGGLIINLIHNDLSDDDIKRVLKLQEMAPFELVPHFIDKKEFQREWGVARPTYYRLMLPDICKTVDRMIYLDCDMIVLDDIIHLWQQDLHGSYLGVCGDRCGLKVCKDLGMQPEKYFNAGMLLMDLAKMRLDNSSNSMKKIIRDNNVKLKYADQDILNYCFWDKSIILHQRWNILTSVYRNLPVKGMYTVEEVKEALSNPGIVHFTGHHKPWLFWKTTHHPYANRFFRYVKMSPISKTFKLKMLLKEYFFNIWKAPTSSVPWDRTIIK